MGLNHLALSPGGLSALDLPCPTLAVLSCVLAAQPTPRASLCFGSCQDVGWAWATAAALAEPLGCFCSRVCWSGRAQGARMDPAAAPVEPPWPLCMQHLHHGPWASSWPRQGCGEARHLCGALPRARRCHVPISGALPGSAGQSPGCPSLLVGMGLVQDPEPLSTNLVGCYKIIPCPRTAPSLLGAWQTVSEGERRAVGPESCPCRALLTTRRSCLGASGCLGDVSHSWPRHRPSPAPGWGRGCGCSWRGTLLARGRLRCPWLSVPWSLLVPVCSQGSAWSRCVCWSLLAWPLFLRRAFAVAA